MEPKNIIIAKVAALGIDTAANGQYASLPQLIVDGIDYVSQYGYEAWLSIGGIYAVCPQIAVEESAQIVEFTHEEWCAAKFPGAAINAMIIEMAHEENTITGGDEFGISMMAYKPCDARQVSRIMQDIESTQALLNKEMGYAKHLQNADKIAMYSNSIAKSQGLIKNGSLHYISIRKSDFVRFAA